MGIVYILSNRWYENDDLYKVGLHHGDHIEDLVRQYRGRYMPEVHVITYWEVGDCITSESYVHRILDKSPLVSRWRNTEWFQGKIHLIKEMTEEAIQTCERDPYRVKIGERIYSLSLMDDENLQRLLSRLDIDPFLSRDSPQWRRAAILLIYLSKGISDSFVRSMGIRVPNPTIPDRVDIEEIGSILGYENDENLITRLYLHLSPSTQIPSEDQVVQIRERLQIVGDTRKELLANMIIAVLPPEEIFSTMTLTQLRNTARSMGLRGYGSLSRDALISLLSQESST